MSLESYLYYEWNGDKEKKLNCYCYFDINYILFTYKYLTMVSTQQLLLLRYWVSLPQTFNLEKLITKTEFSVYCVTEFFYFTVNI